MGLSYKLPMFSVKTHIVSSYLNHFTVTQCVQLPKFVLGNQKNSLQTHLKINLK